MSIKPIYRKTLNWFRKITELYIQAVKHDINGYYISKGEHNDE